MKALIIDPALRSLGGHHFSAARRLHQELGSAGFKVSCLASAYADVNVSQMNNCFPIFTTSVYARKYENELEFKRSVEATATQLIKAARRHAGRPDLIVLPCCDQVLASAVAHYIRRIRVLSTPHILLWILYGPHHLRPHDAPDVWQLCNEARDAFADLATAVGEGARMHAFCETDELTEFYARLTGMNVGTMQGPGLIAELRPSSSRCSPVVTAIGFANRAKGYHLLPEAIRYVLKMNHDATFLVHGIVDGTDAQHQNQIIFEELKTLGPRVNVRAGVLTPEEYIEELNRTDLLLLPYDPTAYRARGSGVFADSCAVGIPVVVTRGCAFARPAIAGGWAIEALEFTPESFGSAINSALSNLAELRKNARSASDLPKKHLLCTLQNISKQIGQQRFRTILRQLRAASA